MPVQRRMGCYPLVYHRLFHDQAPRVVIFADWFVPIGFDSCGLMQVKYHPNFESEKAAFLDMCEPVNLMLWPAQPFEYDWKKRDSHKDPNNFGSRHGRKENLHFISSSSISSP